MLDNKDLLKNLRLLEEEHRDLDEVIYELQQNKTINLMQIIRLKKKILMVFFWSGLIRLIEKNLHGRRQFQVFTNLQKL